MVDPNINNPTNSPEFQKVIFATQANGVLIAVLADADGRLLVTDVVFVTTTVDLDNINTDYDTNPETQSSQTINCRGYRKFTFFYTVTKTGAPTDILIKVQFSQDGGTRWFDYENDFFGDLRFDDTTVGSGGISECVTGDCIAEDMRITVISTGTTSGSVKFTMSNARLTLKN